MSDARVARVALTILTEPGARWVYQLVDAHGPVTTLEMLMRGKAPTELHRTGVAARMTAGDPVELASRALVRGERAGARVLTSDDDEWPDQLRDLEQLIEPGGSRLVERETAPPLCIWVRGSLSLDETLRQSVAVVGARAATSYGEHVATEFGFGLASHGWSVVSGGAYGIDAAAHRGALNANAAPTVSVLACGIDRPYPATNTALFERICDDGLLISEWPPGADPLRHRFLIRNRVIAAATTGTVVVEAAARSGAVQTMGRALELGRRAMVVPGPVTSALSAGCHMLLRDRPEVRLVTGVSHVLEEIGRIGDELAPPVRGPDRPHDMLDDQAAHLLEVVPRRGTGGVDLLASRAGLDTRTALRKLSLLETLGFVVRRDGGYALAPAPKIPRQRQAPP
jgi:DNA processing protein